jgi:predicted esterase
MKIGFLLKTPLFSLFLIFLFFEVQAQKTGNFESTMTYGKRIHSIAYSVPVTYNPANKYPLIVGMHGCPESATELRNALKDFSTQYGAIVVCPDNFGGQVSDGNFILRTIDSTQSKYNIDTSMVFLTGFSCGGQSTLNLGLNHLYNFRGIFPWDPFSASVNYKTYDNEMPVVLAFGNNDNSFDIDMLLYDSMKVYHSPINIVVAQGVAHQIPASFKDIMFKSYRYLLDSNMISMSPVNTVSIDSKSPEIRIVVKNIKDKRDRTFEVTAYSVNPNTIANPSVTYSAGSDSAILTLKPAANIKKTSTTRIVVEAKEIDGTAIEQTVFVVNVKVNPAYPINASSQNSFLTGPENTIDGITTTKWMSQRADSQWICLDLIRNIQINGMRINWSQQAKEYKINVSSDSIEWKEVYSNFSGKSGKNYISFEPVQTRFIQLDCIIRASNAFSISELQVDSGQFTGIKNTILNKEFGQLSLFPNVLSRSENHTTLSYSLQKPTMVNLSVFTIQGQKIKTVVDDFQQAGNYSLNYEVTTDQGTPFGAGIYLFVISTPEFRDQKKFMTIR